MTRSEYILEQSISTATCFDIEIERSLAEMNVLVEMCACYEKAEMFAEYASDPSVVTECGIFLEADAPAKSKDGSNKGNVFSKAWSAVKTFFSNIWKKFLDILEKIMDAPMKKILDQIPPGTIVVQKNTEMFAVAARAAADTLYINGIVEEFIECIKSGDMEALRNVYAKKDSFKNYVNTYITSHRSTVVEGAKKYMSFTKEVMVEWLDEIKKDKKLQKSRKLMKSINEIVDVEELFEKADVRTIRTAVNNVSDYIQETTKFITYTYTKCIKLSARKQKVYDKATYGKAGKMRNSEEGEIPTKGGSGSGNIPNYDYPYDDEEFDIDDI